MRNRCVYIFLLIGFLLTIPVHTRSQQINNLGIPYIKNYSPGTYKASDQNWAIYQDTRGIFYFGNTLGVLEFDGISWQLTGLSNKSSVRAICPDSRGRIYIGGSNDMGYLDYDEAGRTKYNSLLGLIPEKYRSFEDVWDIFNINGKIIFRTHQYIFILKDEKISVIKSHKEFRSASVIENKLYVTDTGSGILTLENDSLKPFLSKGSLTREHTILLPFDNNNILVASRKNGLFLYNGKDLIQWKTEINDFLKKNILYCAIRINSEYYAFGTWLSGVIITDKTGRPIQYLNKEYGLLSNTIYSIYIDNQRNLWCAMDGGISQIEINSPFTFFNANFGFQVQCYTAAVYNNVFYIGGGPYVYFRDWMKYENPLKRKSFTKIVKSAPQLWQLKEIDGKLYGAHSFDILNIDKENVMKIPVNDRIVWDIKKTSGTSELILAGEDNGIYVLKKKNKDWVLRNKIAGFNELARWLVSDDLNNYWCTTYGERIYKLRISKNYDSIISSKSFDIKSNYPLAVGNRLIKIKGKIIVSGADGFYIYDEIQDSFKLYNVLNNLIIKGHPVNITGYDERGNIWFTDFESEGEFRIQPDGGYKVNRTPFYKLDIPSESFPVFTIKDSNIVMGTSAGMIFYNPYYSKNYRLPFKTLIRKIELLENDSLIYGGGSSLINPESDNRGTNMNLQYRNNSIRFTYAASSYENTEKNQFQYQLSGYDKNWSNWSSESRKEYTNLREGQYTFSVRARNVYRVTGTISKLSFNIRPPWYRTILAYFSYFLLTMGIIFIIVYFNSRRLIAANIGLEGIIRERTDEIVKQKEKLQLQYEQLEEINALKDKFYSIISHDLINTIGAIKSFSEMLKEHTIKIDDPKLNKYSLALHNSSKSAFDLLNNLLYWTRLQTGRMKVNAETVNFIGLIEEVLGLYQNIFENKKLQVTKSSPEELFISADKNMMSTVLRNLVSNAAKFTPENGIITISVFHSSGDYTFVISDNGIGIHEDDLKKLFRNDVYFQSHGTNNEIGTGLGLLLIKNFIELHEGKISVESVPEKGSTFSFTAPINLNGTGKIHES